MPKIYTKNTWVDEALVEDAEYSIDGGEPVTIELATDVVIAGTGVTAERMNNIEDGIDGLDDKIIDVEDRLDGFEDSALDTETPELTDKVRGLDDPGGTPISVTFLLSAIKDLFKASYDAVYPSLTGTQTLTNKRITPRVASAADDATAVIDSDSYDEYYLTAIANNTEISVTGTPTTGQTVFIGLKDAGVTKNLTWTGITALGATLPTATTAGKQHIIGIKYIASAWRAIAVAVEA